MHHYDHTTSKAISERDHDKWEERSLIEAIRERGYEPDEIIVRTTDLS